jgi:hypothetical protein
VPEGVGPLIFRPNNVTFLCIERDCMAKKHRGRIQAQGDGTEKSVFWAQDEPLSKQDGLSLLKKLKRSLTRKELASREKPLKDALRYINNVEGGLDAVKKKTFRNRKTKDVRIDLEVLGGVAFISVLLAFVLWWLL